MEPKSFSQVRLRELEQSDLPRLYEFNLDPDANRLAATIARSADSFSAHRKTALVDPLVVAKAIIAENVLAGCISCFKQEDTDSIGYWIAKEFWGKGIASRAWELLLREISTRPLHARVAANNQASLRVLQKCGFVVKSVQVSPADDRYLECEEALLILS